MVARCVVLSSDVIKQEQHKETAISFIIDHLNKILGKSDWRDIEGLDPELQNLYSQWETLEIFKGILYRRFVNVHGTLRWRQLIVPASLRVPLLQEIHAEKTSGHLGVRKTQQSVKRMAYWRGWMRDVELFCRRYSICCRFRGQPTARQRELQQATASGPFVKVHSDLTGPHVRSKNGFVYLLTAIDYFTKYLICVPPRDKSALSVAKAMVKNVYLIHGCPDIQVSDQGKEFQNEMVRNISQMLEIQLSRTCSYRPSSNG